LQSHSAAILETARAVGEFDAIMSLAKIGAPARIRASRDQYRSKDSRARRTASVLEAGDALGEFVPNDLDASRTRGKSC